MSSNVQFTGEAAASIPVASSAGKFRLFLDTSDSALKLKDSSGNVTSVGGSSVQQTSVVTGPTTYSANPEDLVRVDVSAGAVTVNLPTAVGLTNREIWVKLVSIATFTCTITPFGGQLIDGAASASLTTNYEWMNLRSDGANWIQIG